MKIKPPETDPELRITIVVEGRNSDLDEALQYGLTLAHDRMMYVTFSSKKEGGPRVHCRTTKIRRKVKQ